MKKLRQSDHIVVSPEGYITLTPEGKEVAERIYERHQVISAWLTSLVSMLKLPLKMPAVSNM